MDSFPKVSHSNNNNNNKTDDDDNAISAVVLDVNNLPFLTPHEIELRLADYNKEFSTRFSRRDIYYKYANRVKKTPVPIIKPWPPATYKSYNPRKEAILHGHRANFRSKRFRKHNNRALHGNAHSYQFKHENRSHDHRYKHHNQSRARRGHGHFISPQSNNASNWRIRHGEEIIDNQLIASPSQELMGGPEVELENESCLDYLPLTNDENSPYVYDGDSTLPATLPIASSPLSAKSSPSPRRDRSGSSTADITSHPASVISPYNSSDTAHDGEKERLPSPSLSELSDTHPSSFTTPTSRAPQDTNKPQRVNLANLSSLRSLDKHSAKKTTRISNILASTDYSLERPKQSVAVSSHASRDYAKNTLSSPTLQPEESGVEEVRRAKKKNLLISIPLTEAVQSTGNKSRGAKKSIIKSENASVKNNSANEKPIAPLLIRLKGQTWELEKTTQESNTNTINNNNNLPMED